MREILFKGKRTDNGEWVEGCLLQDRDLGICQIEFFDYYYDQDGLQRDYCQHLVLPETVGQYTGLRDCKRTEEYPEGQRIFEGDILKQKTTPEFAKVNTFEWEHYGIVRFGYYDWDEGEAGCSSSGWYIEPLKSVSIKPKDYLVGNIQAGLNYFDVLDKYHPMEVIGNIHDNPELLEVKR